MKMVKHCLPLIDSEVSSLSERISAAPEYDYYEIWLDYLPDDSLPAISKLCEKHKDSLILLNRRLGLEPIQRSFEVRLDWIRSLHQFDCFFDFDIHAQREELDSLQTLGISLKKIISYHNYKSTPADEYLQDVFKEMDVYNPTISKLACFCENATDGTRLLSFLARKSQERALIVLGMGFHGLPTRVFGCELGNEFTFSPIDREGESAPGQLTRGELNEIVEVLNNAG